MADRIYNVEALFDGPPGSTGSVIPYGWRVSGPNVDRRFAFGDEANARELERDLNHAVMSSRRAVAGYLRNHGEVTPELIAELEDAS